MKQYLFYILSTLLLCTACQQDELATAGTTGYLSLEGICRDEVEGVAMTRAVDNDLTLVILQGDDIVATYAPGATATNGKIEMQPGQYRLRAYNDAWQQHNTAQPQFSGETEFSIQPERTTYISLQVPMTNCGVRLTLPDGFDDIFSSFSMVFMHDEASNQSMTSTNQTLYFPTGEISYVMSMRNADGETFSIHNIIDAEAGKVYNLTFEYE